MGATGGTGAAEADTTTDVLVVGAGPTGLALACDLRRRGVRCRLVERGTALFPGSRGKGLQPRSLEVLDDLGVLDAVRAAGGPYPPVLLWESGPGGAPLREFDMIEPLAPDPAVPYGGPWMLPQWRTQELLHERLGALGGGVDFRTGVDGLDQDADGVTVRLDDGSTVRASYVVGCDGGRSTVRRALGIPMHGETVDPAPIVVADVRIAGLGREHWHVWRDQHEDAPGFALCPLAGTDTFQLIAPNATLEPEETAAEPDGAAQPRGAAGGTEAERVADVLRTLLTTRTSLAADQLKEVVHASTFRAGAALAERFRSGRVFLAGDAAHIHSPAGGQGLNTSVQDAYNLGWKLGLVLRHGAHPALLDTYEAERAPLAADVLGLSTRLHRTRSTHRGAETHQLDIAYCDSPLSRHAPSAPPSEALPEEAPAPGDRAPDAPLRQAGTDAPVRLFELLRGPHATLLAVGGAPAPDGLPAWIRTHRVGTPAGPYAEALHLIRPDGHLALTTRDPADVLRYVDELHG